MSRRDPGPACRRRSQRRSLVVSRGHGADQASAPIGRLRDRRHPGRDVARHLCRADSRSDASWPVPHAPHRELARDPARRAVGHYHARGRGTGCLRRRLRQCRPFARPTNLPYDGEVYTLYVLPDHQGAGNGRRLLGALFSALSAAGCRSALVWVLAENPARFFYEAMGGTLIATREEPFHGVVLSECAYGWPDLSRHAEMRTWASDSSG